MAHLLLLHGALGSQEQFDDLKDALSADFTIDTLSFSGHGRTPSQQHAFTIQNLSHEVLHWLNDKQRRKIDIFGYSMGGYVALWLARFYPDRVGKIMTLGTKLDWNEATAEKETKHLNAEKIAAKVPAFAAELQDRHGEHEWHSVLHKTANLMHDLAKHNLTDEDFAQITAQVLLALGDQDNMVTKKETFHVESVIPGAKTIELKDTPHPIDKVSTHLLASEIRKYFK
ncbi:MAG: alpha/beta fold hydrolase [Bacteroidetes bacterium]|nr:alpha/beta fold hydrolase [Bacteroidota bacterium]